MKEINCTNVTNVTMLHNTRVTFSDTKLLITVGRRNLMEYQKKRDDVVEGFEEKYEV